MIQHSQTHKNSKFRQEKAKNRFKQMKMKVKKTYFEEDETVQRHKSIRRIDSAVRRITYLRPFWAATGSRNGEVGEFAEMNRRLALLPWFRRI